MTLRLRKLARVIPALVVAALMLTGCVAGDAEPTGPSAVAAVSKTVTIDVDGEDRSFLLVAPEHQSDESLPVIVAFHGALGNAWNFDEWTGFSDLVDSDRFIAVYANGSPVDDQGEEFAWNAGTCCGPPQTSGANDIGYVNTLLDTLPTYGGDPARVFLTGFSNGGMMSYRTACDLGSRIAGIAVVSGALNVEGCESTDQMPVIIIHGTTDDTVPYEGGPPLTARQEGFLPVVNASVVDAVDFWLTRDGCDAAALTTSTVTETVEEVSFTSCAGGWVDLYTVSGMGHTWPTDGSVLDATALIVDAFITKAAAGPAADGATAAD